jgi:hypothetical protein
MFIFKSINAGKINANAGNFRPAAEVGRANASQNPAAVATLRPF